MDQTLHEDEFYRRVNKPQNEVRYAEYNDESCRFNADNDDRRILTAAFRTGCLYVYLKI